MIIDNKGNLHGDNDGRFQAKEYPKGRFVFGDRAEVTSYDGHRAFVPRSTKGLTTIEIEQPSGYPSTHGIFRSIKVDAYISDDGGIAVATTTDGSRTGYVGEDGSCEGSWFDLESGKEVDVIDGIPRVGIKAESIANGYWCEIHDEIAYPVCKECQIKEMAEGSLSDDDYYYNYRCKGDWHEDEDCRL